MYNRKRSINGSLLL